MIGAGVTPYTIYQITWILRPLPLSTCILTCSTSMIFLHWLVSDNS